MKGGYSPRADQPADLVSGRGAAFVAAGAAVVKMVRDYPQGPLLSAVNRAAEYGLFDLDRLERMVLRQIATDYFVLPTEDKDREPDDER